jgi:hypothetical protein
MSNKPTIDEIINAVSNDELIGWCRECGYQQECVEPDARNYECERCLAHEVYGADEWLYSL